MALFGAFDPTDEDNLDKEAQDAISTVSNLGKNTTPQQAQMLADLYKKMPWVAPKVLLDASKNPNLSPQAQQVIANAGATQYIKQNDPNNPEKKKGWWDRNVYDKVKSISRWTFAGLQFTSDVGENALSQIFAGDNPEGVDGWFKSTQLGTLFAGDDAGEGFFFGGKAADEQARRVREFRGTINGHAWTIGRGAAELVFTPGSKPYSLLSGFIDASWDIFADPTLFAGQALKAAKTGEAAKGVWGTRKISQVIADAAVEKGIVQTDKIPQLTKEAAEAAARISRGEIGINSAEAISFVDSDYFRWFDKNNKAVRLSERFAGYASEATAKAVGLSDEATEIERGKAALKIMQDFRGRIDGETAMRLAAADSPLKVKAVLAEAASQLGRETNSVIIPRQIGDIRGAGATYAARELARERVPLWRNIRHSSWWEQIPTEGAIVNGSSLDRAKSIRTMDQWMRGIGYHTAKTADYENFMGKTVAYLSDTDGAKRNIRFEKLYDEFIEKITEFAGGDKAIATETTRRLRDELAKVRTYAIDNAGLPDDGGLVQMLRQYIPDKVLEKFSPDELDNLKTNGPGALIELVDKTLVLPDFRKYRAIVGNPVTKDALRRVARNKEGEERILIAVTNQLQQEVWKPLVLATGGYIVRNMIDSHIRIAARGYQSFFTHPFQFIQTVIGSRYVGPLNRPTDKFGRVLARTFEEMDSDEISESLAGIWDDYSRATNKTVYNHLKDPLLANERQFRGENFAIVTRQGDRAAHTTGYIDSIGQVATDPILQQMSRYWRLPRDERNAKLIEWMENTAEGKRAKADVLDFFSSGVRLPHHRTGKNFYVTFDQASDNEKIMAWLEGPTTARIQTLINGDEDMRFIIQHDRVPLIETVELPNGTKQTQVAPLVNNQRLDTLTPIEPGKPLDVGSVINMGNGNEGVITDIRTIQIKDPFNPGVVVDEQIADVQPVFKGAAFTRRKNDPTLFGTEELRRMVDIKGDEGILPQFVKRAERIEKGKTVGLDKLSGALDTGVRWFFGGIVGTAQKNLERSPFFRQAFYKEVADSAMMLSRDEQLKLQKQITDYVADLNQDLSRKGFANLTEERYVGGKDIYNKIFGTAATGDATIDDLQNFASAVALYDVERTLYNAAEKSNFEDMFRIVAPFATAFRETLGKYSQFLIEDPSRIRKTQLAVNAMTYDNDDPDDFISGFFDKDPVDGKSVFNVPIGGWVGGILAFPTKGPFQVSNLPGFGPVVQIAASNLLPDTPKLDDFRKFVLPYGEQNLSAILPAWARRGFEAVKADTTNAASMFGQTYVDTIKYLMTTGKYDTSNPDEMAQLYADAKGKARNLTILRSFFQFMGPTSPRLDFRVDLENGDVLASSIAEAWYDMRSENPDTAVERFIETFGEEAFSYMGSKTRAVAGGVENTEAFREWQIENGDLFEQYSNVAGYLAPGGDIFSFQAYNRALQAGLTRRLTPVEVKEAADYIIGNFYYRRKRDAMGDTLSDEQRAWLGRYREVINKKFPGFPVSAQFNPNQLDDDISDLRRLTSDARVADNPTAASIAKYINYRDQALAEAEKVGLTTLDSKQAAPLRDWLSSIARVLIEENPEFARIYTDKFSPEVDK
jgi:hypothetical protein